MRLNKEELLKAAEAIWPMSKVWVQPISSISWAQKATAEALREIANHEDLAKYEEQAETLELRDAMIAGYKQRIDEREQDLAADAIAISERNQAIRELRGVIETIRAAAESEMGTVAEIQEVLDKTKQYAIGD